jgi:hypothetical protein
MVDTREADAMNKATIRGDAEAFVRVVYGRLDPTSARADGVLEIEPASLADDLRRWFTGI